MAIDFSKMTSDQIRQVIFEGNVALQNRSDQERAERKQSDTKYKLVDKLKLMDELEALEKEIESAHGSSFKHKLLFEIEAECEIRLENRSVLDVLQCSSGNIEDFIARKFFCPIEATIQNAKDDDERSVINEWLDDLNQYFEIDNLKILSPEAHKKLYDLSEKAMKFWKKLEERDLFDAVLNLREEQQEEKREAERNAVQGANQ